MIHLPDTKTLLLMTFVWAVAAYVIVPRLWVLYFRHHPLLVESARVTLTGDGHPGDPVNVALVGTRGRNRAGHDGGRLVSRRRRSRLASTVRIAADTVLHRPDDDAPVSNLFLFGRKQDLAFEQPLAGGPSQRHHVRFWRWDELYEGRPGWFGAATFDARVGLSHTTGQVTHHIAPDVDAERDRLASELQQAGVVQSIEWKDGFHAELEGRNGGGDPWHTDGRLAIVSLRGSV